MFQVREKGGELSALKISVAKTTKKKRHLFYVHNRIM